MYPLPIARPYDVRLYALVALWAALLILGFALGPLNEARTNRIPQANRMASSFILVLCALIWWRVGTSGTSLAPFAGLIFLGMSFSFLGDLIMAQVIRTPDRVIFGIGAFGLAHVSYIAGYLWLGRVLGLTDGRVQVGAVVVFLALAVILWLILIRAPDAPPVLSYGSLGYALLLSAMVGLAVALAVQERHFVPLAVGAALFLISDTILGNQIFRDNHWLLVGDVVWTTYIVGQLLIVFSPAAALRVLGSLGKALFPVW